VSAFSRFAAPFAALSGAVQGALYMTGAALCFSGMNLLVRIAAEEVNPIQIAFFRNLFALLFMLPWLARVGFTALYTRRPGLHVVRALVGLAGMFLWFTSVALLPLAEAVALNFTMPLFATVGAALILGEVVRARRWTATAIGFAGTLVILRPGFTETSALALLPILAAVFMASAVLLVKVLAREDRPGTIVLYMNLYLTPLSLIPALLVWRWPSATMLLALVLLGLLAVLAHVLMTRAYARADASAVQPFDYARLPFIALLAYVFLGEVPDPWTWPGAALIAGSAIYIAQREAKLARAGLAPAGARAPDPARRE